MGAYVKVTRAQGGRPIASLAPQARLSGALPLGIEPFHCQVNIPLFRLLCGLAENVQYTYRIPVDHIKHAKSPIGTFHANLFYTLTYYRHWLVVAWFLTKLHTLKLIADATPRLGGQIA